MRREWEFETKDFAAAHRARRELRRLLSECGLMEDDAATCELVFGELVANALKYGENPVLAAVECAETQVRLEVEDCGKCFALPARLTAPLDSVGGRGLFIASALTWSLDVDRSSDRCRVSATLQLHPANLLKAAS